MNQIKRIAKMLSIVLILSMAVQLALPGFFTTTATAATIAISPKKLTLEVGKTKVLKVTGTKVKATWKSSDAKIAAVSKTGLVTAKKAGKATITATVNKKAYTCSVTVKDVKVKNPLVDAAPFKAQGVTSGNVSYIFPSSWNKYEGSASGLTQIFLSPETMTSSTDDQTPYILLYLADLAAPSDADTLAAYYKEFTADTIVSQFAQSGMDVTVNNFTLTNYATDLGIGYLTSFDYTYQGLTVKRNIYDIYTDKTLIKVMVSDPGKTTTPDLNQAADYLLKTIQISK